MKIYEMTEKEYLNKEAHYWGYCRECCDWTRQEAEGDAENYHCPDCDGETVVGAMNALLMGMIDIIEDGPRHNPDKEHKQTAELKIGRRKIGRRHD